MGEGFVRGWGWWALVFVLRVVLKKKRKKDEDGMEDEVNSF